MAEAVLMIALSPTMEKGKIASWQKKAGETVETGDILCEVETDKATMDYEATQEGTLLEILLEEGEDAPVGEPIAIIGEKGEDVSELKAELNKQPPESAASSTSKEEKAKEPKPSDTPQPVQHEEDTDKTRIKASPLARRLADQAGIDLASIPGSGPGGRRVKRDVEKAQQGSGGKKSIRTASGEDRVEKVSGKRSIIASRLSESMQQAPHYYLNMDVQIERLIQLRSQVNQSRQKQGESKLSLNAFLIKLSAEALRRHPEINTSWEGDSIRYFGSIDIGLAVAQEDGLITPIVRNCGAKGIAEIDEELKDLIPRAQKGKLQSQEYEGAGFSITNLGSFGVRSFTAVINPPGSAILAVGTARKQPYPEGENGFRFVDEMSLNLGCDHRLIDGAVGAAFLADLKAMIEEPGMVLI